VSTDLRDRLSAIDPVQQPEPYSTAEQALLVQRIISAGESRPPVCLADGSQRDRLRPGRRLVVSSLSAAAAAAFAVTLLTEGLATSSAPADESPPRSSSADPAHHDAAVVTLALQRLAATVSGPAPTGVYLYTRTRLTEVGLDHGDPQAKQDSPSFRYVRTETIQSWQGTTCNDRLTETRAPLAFPSPRDRQAALTRSREQVYLREIIRGGTTTTTGTALGNLDDIPCDRLGTISHPNPPYIAMYPTTADAFLAKVRRDLAAQATDTPLDAGLMTVLETPWLTDLQRAAGLRAFAQVPGLWKVSGSETVAGIRGLRVVRSVPGSGTQEELVLAARAPGVLRRTETLTDPSTADQANRAHLKGLAPGTVTYDKRVLAVATVPHPPAPRRTP